MPVIPLFFLGLVLVSCGHGKGREDGQPATNGENNADEAHASHGDIDGHGAHASHGDIDGRGAHASHGDIDGHEAHASHGDIDGHAHSGGHGKHGNPEDLAAYVAKMEDASRNEWQKPDRVIGALKLLEGQTVCDIGAGPGYFSFRIARAVGERGQVLAVDVEPSILDVLRTRIGEKKVHNVTPILGLPGDPLIAPAACDLILIVDTYHHFPDGVAYLEALARRLAPGGRIVNIDFHKREMPVGPPLGHKVSREDFLKDAESAGLRLIEEPNFLPYQYFLIFDRRP